jgi:PAS domain S-box-containing protein
MPVQPRFLDTKPRVSSERFEILFELSLDSIIVSDMHGCITRANPAFISLMGYAHEEIIGRPLADVVLPGPGTYACRTGGSVQVGRQYEEELTTMFVRLFQEGSIKQWQTWFVRKDRAALFVEHHLVALYDSDGRPDGALSIIRDVTEKTAMQDALRKSEERFRTFFEYAPDAIYISDESGIFLDGNRSAEQLTGYRREELIGKNYFELDLLSDDEFPKALELLERNLSGSPTGPDEFVLKRKDGAMVSVEICTYPLYLQEGHCVLGMAHDITDRKQAEQDLIKARETLEARVRERTQDLLEANTALRVLLNSRDDDRAALEESMLHNVHELVLPCIEKLRAGKLQDRQQALLGLLETILRDITAPMLRSLTLQHLRLTPAEISVANCIRQGKQNREIADVLQLSIKTVQFHRENIRRKCGIKNKKVNLQTFLASLA